MHLASYLIVMCFSFPTSLENEGEPAIFAAKGDEPPAFVSKGVYQIAFLRLPTHLIVEYISAATAFEGGAMQNTPEIPITQRARIIANGYQRKLPRKLPDKVVELIFASEGEKNRKHLLQREKDYQAHCKK